MSVASVYLQMLISLVLLRRQLHRKLKDLKPIDAPPAAAPVVS
jgi:hypothetical protein